MCFRKAIYVNSGTRLMKARVINPVNFGLRPRAALIFQRVWAARAYMNAFLLFCVARE